MRTKGSPILTLTIDGSEAISDKDHSSMLNPHTFLMASTPLNNTDVWPEALILPSLRSYCVPY